MGKTGILLVGFDDAGSRIAVEAARMVFPDAVVAPARNLNEAVGRDPHPGTELLALAFPNPADLGRALAAVDAADLPRWAVVTLGARVASAGVETLTDEEWTVPMVAHAFRSSVAQHALRIEIGRSRGDLLTIGSRVTHEMRSQVAGILSSSELMKEILADEDPSRAELTQPIFDSVDGLGKIIENLAFVAKASARGAAKKRTDMGDLVFRALQRLDGEILKKKASLSQPAVWPEVPCDGAWIEKVWCVLVANVLKHGAEAPRIELGWSQDKGECRFWVRDNGAGVAPDLRSQLFQPFHLLHRTNSPRGMGLPMVRRLVEMQGGRCGFESGKDGSSQFFFTLPV